MPSLDQIFALNGGALQLRSQRLNMLASNIANASTPGYKAKDLDFDRAMQQAQNGSSIDTAMNDHTGFRVPLQPSLDGNTVELSVEQTLFAENAIQYRTTLSFLNGQVASMKRALKGE
ncbi:flagellar basal body rod protein FlgB [Sphingorhabdus sp. Alg231-15]|uniref:flagellar basal body rod protein FlgB n=1 Tax=Sphingorhabdus sp. Alg231-15 TaxID=1922222 RepID=UPI000D55711B